MSKKTNTFATAKIVEVNGLKVYSWTKRCPVCKTEFSTTSRSQKYCCEECCKKDQKRKRRQKKEYDATKEIRRLSARSHSIAVETMEQLAHLGLVEKRCECGCTENLQVHHINLRWLDNRPENLKWVCTKCHAEIHSEIEKNKVEGVCTIPLEEDELYRKILK